MTDDADFYYLVNGKHAETVKPAVAAIDHDVTLRRTGRGTAVPYLLDPWTGEAVRLARYTEDGDAFTVRVTLQPGETMIVALGRPGLFGDRHGNRPHVLATDADEALFTGTGLAVRTAAAGTFTTRLSQGRPVTTTVREVPEPITPVSWR
ncbi:alpha-L-rhamnosidase, partial [Streptomyces sp. TRM76130]|nr:alpha-L-rhamnosidase [Streptomyces sp. TRM76130]